MPWIALPPSKASWGVSDGVEIESWCWNENLKMLRWASNWFSQFFFLRFGDAQFDEMMSKVIVLSSLFFFNFTRFRWWQFRLVIVNDSAFWFILKFDVLLRQNFTSFKLMSSTPEILKMFYESFQIIFFSSFIELTEPFYVNNSAPQRLGGMKYFSWTDRFSSLSSSTDKSMYKLIFQRLSSASRKQLLYKKKKDRANELIISFLLHRHSSICLWPLTQLSQSLHRSKTCTSDTKF